MNRRGTTRSTSRQQVDDEGDDLTDHERHALHEALSKSWESAGAAKLRPASEIIDELRRKG